VHTYFIIITITSVWNRKRSCPLTNKGHVVAKNKHTAILKAQRLAEVAWENQYSTVAADRYVIDFVFIEEVLIKE
jgi:hypothetical protein